MKYYRYFFIFALLISIVWSDVWLPKLYLYNSHNSVKVYPSIVQFEVKGTASNVKKYELPLSKIHSSNEPFSVAFGRFYGDMNISCEYSVNDKSVTEKVLLQKQDNASGSHEFGYCNIPFEKCDRLIVETPKVIQSVIGELGWRSGVVMIGPTPIVSAFKNISDFFSSYIRALLGLLVLIFVLFESKSNTLQILGLRWYRAGASMLAIHFIASSSVLNFLFPNEGIFGFPLLKSGGSSGFFLLCLGMGELLENERAPIIRRWSKYSLPFSLCLSLIVWGFYICEPGSSYIYIQSTLALATLVLSVISKSRNIMITASLFICDILSVKGFLPGMPTNSSTHFFVLNYIYDSFEWTLKNNKLLELINSLRTRGDSASVIKDLKSAFGISRLSYSVFTREGLFKTFLFNSDGSCHEVFVNKNLSRVSASVMTTRLPILRLNISSERSKILTTGDFRRENQTGSEYCVFPLIYNEKIIGTFNATEYSSFELADPPQMKLFLTLLERVLPKFSEILYREDLSPNVDEEKEIFEIESKFSSATCKSRDLFIENINFLSKSQGMKIIVSKKIENLDQLKTFTNHNYTSEDSAFLDQHAPKLSETIVSSPANVAYLRRTSVFVNDVTNMYSVYPEFLISLLKRNETKYLWASPVIFQDETIEPWGVIWIESPNRVQRTESDLRDLIEIVAKSIERQLRILIDYESSEKFKTELGALIPAHVRSKIERGIDPREEERGFLLNIDLCGSTKLAKKIGDLKYSLVISEANLHLTRALSKYGFVPQLIIWDAFIFTCASSTSLTQNDVITIVETVNSVIRNLSINEQNAEVSFRAVLHFGDTTRDMTNGSVKTWGVVGSALAESCKIEAVNKHIINDIVTSDQAHQQIEKDAQKAS